MKTFKILPASFMAVAALLSGLTIATAQDTTETAPAQAETTQQAQNTSRADFRGPEGHRGRKGGHMMFGSVLERVDTDGDGAITQAEIDAFRASLVADADASGDGDISLDEFQDIYLDLTRDRMVDMFQKLDRDGDGVVTQAETDARFGNIVARMDRNDDGMLSRDDRGGRGHHGQDRGTHSRDDRRGHDDDRG